MSNYVSGYNIEFPNSKLELVLFKDALNHLSRITRILRQQRGNALLIGVGGCGKQTLTKLSAFISGSKISQLSTTKDYKLGKFREDLKLAMKPAGSDNKRITLLINDNQITEDIFLEDVNNIFNSGEVPNLWEFDEKEEIKEKV